MDEVGTAVDNDVGAVGNGMGNGMGNGVAAAGWVWVWWV